MKRMYFLLFPLLLALGACGENESETPCAPLIGGGSYCLQPTAALAPFDVQQKVEATFRGRRETMIAEIESDAEGMRFVGLTPFGQKLLQVAYDNRAASAATLPDRRISPALLIALLQIALWPADAVRAGLEEPLTLDDGAGRRRIHNRGEATISIDYRGAQPPYRGLRISVPAADLELEIETLDALDAIAADGKES